MRRVLVIDDDETVRDVLNSFLGEKGFEVITAERGESGLELLLSEKFDLALVDLVMPGMGGIDILKELSSRKIKLPVIIITAYGTIQNAVEAMKLGAFDYVTKPFNLDEIMLLIERALEHARLEKENLLLRKQLRQRYNFSGLIGDSIKMQRVYELIEKVADTDSTILITGESGTGKELVAKTIHYNSSRADGPFVPLNCAAIPRDLLESELFGHEKGAFTGAISTRIGRFELANNGTLFLDEIGELDPSLQVKLLRVIQEREFERVGGVKTIKVDVRIIAATNRNLEEAVAEGKFREDLYWRLNVIPIHLPPLRERREDIPLLVDYFIKKFQRKRKGRALVIPPEAMSILIKYEWPGNVRELENLIERLSVLITDETVKIQDLPEKFIKSSAIREEAISNIPAFTDEGIDLQKVVEDIERDLILKALQKAEGVRSKAATLLGINRTTLIEKMKRLGIS
ncbi:MAG: sigma-54 dependent transcriptional regulator [Thermodesulfovibrionales bacterium]|nr:sigma-54 dependent transcriptional regulator [Thermodesulfovibrionales bacterium]